MVVGTGFQRGRAAQLARRELADRTATGEVPAAATGFAPTVINSQTPVDADAHRVRLLVVVLDGITDPHNYGAIIRSCDQFGVSLIVNPNSRSAKDSETVARTSAGASAWMPIATVPNLVRAVGLLKEAGFWVYGADMGGEPAHKKDLTGRVALVMGSEGEGIARLLREACDGIVSIPSKGQIDSLNVSVAAGVLLYEINRQRNFK